MKKSNIKSVTYVVSDNTVFKEDYKTEFLGRSPILNVLAIFICIMLFITMLRVSFGGSEFIFTDLLSFFANFSNISFVIPAISSVSTGIVIIDALLNAFITGINCFTFIISTLFNVCLFLAYIVAFIFSF